MTRTRRTALALLASLSLAALLPAAADAGSRPRDLSPRPDNGFGYDQMSPDYGSTKRPAASIRSLTGRKVHEGDEVRFEIKSNRDGYGHVYVISASGRAQLWMENVPLKAGRKLRFPDGDYTINATGPEGKDKIVLIVTRTRLNGLLGRETTDIPEDIDLDRGEFREAIETMMRRYPRTDWTWAHTFVEVVEN